MKALDLLMMFEDGMGRFMTNSYKAFITTDIERFLNDSASDYIQALSDMYEYNERARRALVKLVKTDDIAPVVVSGITKIDPNSYLFEPPVDLLRIVEEQATISGTDVAIIPITHDQFLANRDNPYKNPYEKLVWRLDVADHIELVSDGGVISFWKVRYIQSFPEINFESTTDLPLLDNDLDKIVEIAIKIAVKSLSVGRPKEN